MSHIDQLLMTDWTSAFHCYLCFGEFRSVTKFKASLAGFSRGNLLSAGYIWLHVAKLLCLWWRRRGDSDGGGAALFGLSPPWFLPDWFSVGSLTVPVTGGARCWYESVWQDLKTSLVLLHRFRFRFDASD